MRRITLLLWLLPLLVACRSGGAAAPTPFPTAGPTVTVAGGGPVVLTVTELMAAPGLYRDVAVQLTGLLRKQPVIICDSELHASPAGWGLAEPGAGGSLVAAAGGFEQQVRSLLPGDLLMTIEGRWRRWEGLVGCGKQAQQQEVWYLAVDRILTPSPLTQVTLTPQLALGGGGGGTEVAGVPLTIEPLPTEETAALPSPELEFTPEGPPPTQPAGGYPMATEELGSIPTPTLPAGMTPTLETDTTPLAGGTPTPTITGTPPTPTPTITGTPGTPTPTVTGTPPTPTPTGTGGAGGQVVDQGLLLDLQIDDFMTASLAAGTIHSWDFEIFEDEEMFLYVVAPGPADLVVTVMNGNQTVINRQNNAPPGSPEFINNPSLPGTGTYQVLVSEVGGAATEYGIAGYIDAEFPIIIAGVLTSGSPRNSVQLPVEAVHLWFFMASAGDDLTVRIDPQENLDPAADLYGPEAEYLEPIDDGFEGEEELFEITLETTGLHALRIVEIASEQLTYDLEITLE